MMETVAIMKKRYKRVLSYGEKKDNGKFGRSDKRMEKIENCGPHAIRDGIKITMNKIASAANVGVRGSSAASYALGLMDNFKMSTVMIIWLLRAGSVPNRV